MLSERVFISSPYVPLDDPDVAAYCAADAPQPKADPMRCTPLVLFVALAACTAELPDVNTTISAAARNADFPTLEPLPDLIARSEAGSSIAVQTEALEGRVARLNARAAALRGRTVIDGATRLKLTNAVRDRRP